MRNWIFLILLVFQSLLIYGQQTTDNGQQSSAISHKPTANSQRPTANSQRPTANSQQPTANSQRPTANSQRPTANSQRPTANSQSYLKSYWHSGLTILKQPLHYDWKDWTVFGGVAAATTLAFVYDDEIFNYVDKTFSNSQSNTISQYTDIFGEELFIVPSIAVTYAVGAIDKNPRLKNLSLATLQSFIFAEVASAGIKVLTCRVRPVEAISCQPTANSKEEWLGPFATFESTSFVSGHATRAFALATTVAGFYPEKKWVGIVSYSLATATSLGRIVSKEHWASDVIAGAALGYFIGRGVVIFNEKIGNINSIKIEPVATNYGIGIVMKF